jgi:hypothetical protein
MGFFSALPWSKKQKFPATTSKAPYDIYAEYVLNVLDLSFRLTKSSDL